MHEQVFAPLRSRPVKAAHQLRCGKHGRSLPSLGCSVPRFPAILLNVAIRGFVSPQGLYNNSSKPMPLRGTA